MSKRTEEIRERLLPCPFCGSGGAERRTSDHFAREGGPVIHCIRCDGCHCETPWLTSADQAVAAWNRRTP